MPGGPPLHLVGRPFAWQAAPSPGGPPLRLAGRPFTWWAAPSPGGPPLYLVGRPFAWRAAPSPGGPPLRLAGRPFTWWAAPSPGGLPLHARLVLMRANQLQTAVHRLSSFLWPTRFVYTCSILATGRLERRERTSSTHKKTKNTTYKTEEQESSRGHVSLALYCLIRPTTTELPR